MLQNLAKSIVRRYPAAWRERYETEVLDLIDSAHVRAYDVGELFRNMLVEQVRATVDIERPTEAAAKVARYKLLSLVASVGVTQSAGWLLWWWRPLSDNYTDGVAAVAIGFWISLLVMGGIHAWRQHGRSPDDREPFPVWLAMATLPVHLVVAATWLWAGLSAAGSSASPVMNALSAHYNNLYLQGTVSTVLLIQIWPGQRMVTLLQEFQMADGAVNGARGYIASCEEWIAKGVPSPLTDAKAALEQRIRERDAIRERLEKVGSRPRFIHPS